MKNLALWLLLITTSAYAGSRDLVKYLPQYSYSVIGADLIPLRDNEVFVSMERKGQIWSYEDDSEIVNYFRILKIDPKKDVKTFVFSKYLNSYGSAGKLHVFELNQEIAPLLSRKSSTKYLGVALVRLEPDQDRYVVPLDSHTVAMGRLNEVKMALDLSRGKLPNMTQNLELKLMLQKLPDRAPVWGMAVPLSRRKAAATNAKQSTNAMLQAFQSYYFYGVPAKTNASSHFYGLAKDDKEAAVVTAFMIGTLAIAKFRANETLAEVLDQVDIQHNGNNVHVSAVLTKEMVDAFFDGSLGVN